MKNEPQLTVPSISTEGWTFDSVLEHSSNFVAIERVHANDPNIDLEEVIRGHEENGIPLILDGWHKRGDWPKTLFTLDFFQRHSPKDMHVRNVHDWQDTVMSLADFIRTSRANPPCAPPGEQIRMYGKDAECPKDWSSWIKTGGVIPEVLHWNGSNDYFRYRPKNAPVQTLMCYAGIGDTFTPAHKDLCASSGHNLMCHTEMNGSSYWFMTKSSDAAKASDFFQRLGQELDHEAHVISLDELAKAPFTIYVAEQALGDLVLVPPRSCHQVVNFGGITLKTSWSRMTLEGLITAYYHELPIYQRVCRAETYRVKSTIFCALRAQTKELEQLHPGFGTSTRGKKKRGFTGKPNSKSYALIQSLQKLVGVFREIVAQEYSGKDHKTLAHSIGELNDEQTMEHRIVCDFCGGDIFQAFFECGTCVGVKDSNGHADAYTICPACYVDGRSCHCLTMHPRHCFPHKELCRVVEQADKILSDFDPEWSENREELDADYSVFKAACHLVTQRTLKYICNYDKEVTYGMSCKHDKGCHNSRCFRHLLERCNMHSVQALSIYYKNVENYHTAHLQSKGKYAESEKAIAESQNSGSKGPIDMLRVHYALKYRSCRPWAAERSSGGFYDTDVQRFGEIEDGDGMLISPPYTASVTSTEAGSTYEPAMVADATRSDRGPTANGTVPRTRQKLAQRPDRRVAFGGVTVPPAPYPTNSHPTVTTSIRIGPPRGRRATTKSSQNQPLHPVDTSISQEEDGQENQEVVLPSETRAASLPRPQDADVDMDAFTDPAPSGASSSSLSASSKRHRFRSGMIVTLEDTQPLPMDALPFATEAPSPPPPRSPPQPPMLPIKARTKRKHVDPGISLADALNQANAQNSEELDSPPRKRKRPTQRPIHASEEPSQRDTGPASESTQAPPALMTPSSLVQSMQHHIETLIASGAIDADSIRTLRQAANDKRDPELRPAADSIIAAFLPVLLLNQAPLLAAALQSQSEGSLSTKAVDELSGPSTTKASSSTQVMATRSTVPSSLGGTSHNVPETVVDKTSAETVSKDTMKGSSRSVQRTNAAAGPSKTPKTQKSSLSAPVTRRPPPPPRPSGKKLRTRPSVSSSISYTSISSSDPIGRKGKGKEKEQATARSRSRSSQASRMREDKEPSPKTREKMLSTLTHEVMRTRIPKVPWKPEGNESAWHDGMPTTSSASSSSLFSLNAGDASPPGGSQDAGGRLIGPHSNIQLGGPRMGEDPTSTVSAPVHLHAPSTMLPPQGYPHNTQPQDEYDLSVSLGMSTSPAEHEPC
ncbi:hypothetical protein BKA70DRAFT_1246998 [Coprinopsis sp. MPI-PUGE-AT-0042]|nr:hypothetical protein BKA70DRAFT_1246998 [Coprinopsis sp. MPI-PUGE-AT-0042]